MEGGNVLHHVERESGELTGKGECLGEYVEGENVGIPSSHTVSWNNYTATKLHV